MALRPRRGLPQIFIPSSLTLTGLAYDASGNLTNDGTHAYTFDGDENLTAVDSGNSASYTFDAEGKRVGKSVHSAWTQYVFFGGEVIAENRSSGWSDYVYANGGRLARATGTASTGTVYYHGDHLGTARMETNAAGTVIAQCTYAPFGQVVTCPTDDGAN
ncbi:MAG TPA: hypothetical protein VJR23_14945, partial [Candidatus Acidoferrales bacterium]|nr:hypothetical protein [Candidatus Acidoferrales bacterium]